MNLPTHLARVAADAALARRLGDALAERFAADAAVAIFEIADGRWMVEVHFTAPPARAAIRRLVQAVGGGRAVLTFATVAPRDWVKASLAGLAPVAAGRFLVHGAHDRAAVGPNRLSIEIEAGLAFGTGHHATTRGCLLALDRLMSSRRARGRHAVLDLGTGSGVLAIAAARALRRRVVASDIDKLALAVARDNARINGAASLIELVHARGLAAHRLRERGPYELVFANILLAPLKIVAAPMARLLAPGARVVLSGLLVMHAAAALAAYAVHGLALERRIVLDGWATLVLRRRA